jgi:hypothetical protein
VPPGPSRDSPHRAVIPCDMPEYQCPWFQFYRASNFYCMAIAAEPLLPSGPPLATDWAAVSVTVALETTRHAPGTVRQAGGDKLQRCPAAAAAAAIATTKIGRTRIAMMPTLTTLTRMTGMGGPCDRGLCASFDRIREFVLSHALLFCNDGGKVGRSDATQDAVFPVLHARPNLNPMGASRRRRRGQGGGGWRQQ